MALSQKRVDRMESVSQDTKTLIFSTAMRLFAANGYENVSIRTIADTVGIKTASIYYHFTNKEEILLACYQYYLDHRHSTRLTKEQYDPILRHGTKEEILNVVNYAFPAEVLEYMICALVIIFSRIYCDPAAKDLYIEDIDNSMEFLQEFFSYGIQIGRFYDFNIPAVALIFLSSRLFCAQSVTIQTDKEKNWFQFANYVFDDLLHLIPFRY